MSIPSLVHLPLHTDVWIALPPELIVHVYKMLQREKNPKISESLRYVSRDHRNALMGEQVEIPEVWFSSMGFLERSERALCALMQDVTGDATIDDVWRATWDAAVGIANRALVLGLPWNSLHAFGIAQLLEGKAPTSFSVAQALGSVCAVPQLYTLKDPNDRCIRIYKIALYYRLYMKVQPQRMRQPDRGVAASLEQLLEQESDELVRRVLYFVPLPTRAPDWSPECSRYAESTSDEDSYSDSESQHPLRSLSRLRNAQ